MTVRPKVIACAGGSPLSRAAERVARELERRGLASAEAPITLDGCETACARRRLVAEGHPPATSLVLSDFGIDAASLPTTNVSALADEIAVRLKRASAAKTLTRLPNPSRRVPAQPRRPHTVDDYLLALDALTNPVVACGAVISNVPTLAAHVSAVLGVSRPSAGEMLARMEASGLVHRGGAKELLLSESGRAAADRAVERHRLLEVFAFSFLGYSLPESFEQARILGAAFSTDAVQHLAVALGSPAACPHGWPVDPAAARAEDDTLVSLAALVRGDRAVVARVAENSAALAELVELGLIPGATIAVHEDTGAIAVDGHDVRLAASDEAAAAIIVRRQGAGAG